MLAASRNRIRIQDAEVELAGGTTVAAAHELEQRRASATHGVDRRNQRSESLPHLWHCGRAQPDSDVLFRVADDELVRETLMSAPVRIDVACGRPPGYVWP